MSTSGANVASGACGISHLPDVFEDLFHRLDDDDVVPVAEMHAWRLDPGLLDPDNVLWSGQDDSVPGALESDELPERVVVVLGRRPMMFFDGGSHWGFLPSAVRGAAALLISLSALG
jgi:hypothetical protein